MSEISKFVAALSPEQRNLLLRRVRDGRLASPAGTPAIQPRRDRETPAPLSFAQQRLWFLDQLQPGSPAYNVPIAILISGPLSVSALKAALRELTERHPSLRTTFRSDAGQVVQVVAAVSSVPLGIVDLGGLVPRLAEAVLQDLYAAESLRPFDLATGPLLRATLFERARDHHVLFLVLHHIVSDLWSLRVLVRDLSAIYGALAQGKRHSLPLLPVQYVDFAVWQRETSHQERIARQLEYWRKELAHAPRALALPADRSRPAVLGSRGEWLPWRLPFPGVQVLKSLGKEEGTTLFMTLLAGFSLLLARYSGQEDLVVGSPIANRTRTELEGLIGFFVNMLPFRVDLAGRASFRQLLGRVREKCVLALAHQDLPFEQLVDELGIERDLSRHPLFQAVMTLQTISLPPTGLTDLRFELLNVETRIVKFDLAMELQDEGREILGSLGYSRELFERSTAMRMGRHFAVLLERAGAAPDEPVWEVPLLTGEERQQLLIEGWGGEAEAGAAACLGDLFSALAAEHPERIAVAGEDGAVSYHDLEERSNQIAISLRLHGVGLEVPVAVLLHRSPALVAGLLGVLKAGGVAVPLDPAQGRAATAQALERTTAAVLLTDAVLAATLPEHGAEVVKIESIGADERKGSVRGIALPESLAFVVQSSRRGHPRWLGWEHRSLAVWARGGFDLVLPLYRDERIVLCGSVTPGIPAGSAGPVRVLDREGRPVPLGVVGELHLAGERLARGYLGEAERTASRFVPDPFAGRPGGRLFRTGDRARWCASGEVELLRPAIATREVRSDLPEEEQRKEARRDPKAPRSAVEKDLLAIWEAVLGRSGIGLDDNFFALGGDSILSLQIIGQARKAGWLFTLRQLFQHQTVAKLARVAEELRETSGRAEASPTEPFALTPIQRWFFEQDLGYPWHFNQALFLSPRRRLDPRALALALTATIAHHDALRLRFLAEEGLWRQRVSAPDGVVPFCHVNLVALPGERRKPAMEEAASRLEESLDLRSGPVLRLTLFELGDEDRLLWILHHLVVDGVSWRILLQDLESAYRQLEAGRAPAIVARTTSWASWSRRLSAYGREPRWAKEAAFWQSRPWERLPPAPVDDVDRENTESSVELITVTLEEEETRRLLERAPRGQRAEINDLLLAALFLAWRSWTGHSLFGFDLEGHGRQDLFEDVDLSRTVGWFTILYPVLLEAPEGAGPLQVLDAVQEQLRALPDRGLGYGILRYLATEAGQALAALSHPPLLFNYLGQLDLVFPEGSLLSPAPENPGPTRSARERRRYLFEVNAGIVERRLHLEWRFSARIHRRATVERLAGGHLAALRTLIEACAIPLLHDLPRVPSVATAYPLTPLQEGILFHSLSAPGQGMYVTQLTGILDGDLDRTAFTNAWELLIERHAVLRTGFLWAGLDKPLQVVFERVDLPLVVKDEPHLAREDIERWLGERRGEDAEEDYDLSRAPLFRLRLWRTTPRSHLFLWSFHHLLLDGWSLALILGELFGIYEAYIERREPQLPKPRPYRDYIDWLGEQNPEEAQSFWRRRLAGFERPTVLRLPPLIAAEGRSAPATLHLTLPRELRLHLSDLVRRNKLTLYTLFEGMWALLLRRYSGEEEVVFGTVMSGRPALLAGVGSMVGLFINTVPTRARVMPGATLTEWLQGLQTAQMETQEHQHTSLSEIQGWSEIGREQPLFSSILVFENFPVERSLHERRGTLGIRALAVEERTNYSLSLLVSPGEEVSLRLLFDRCSIEPSAARGMLGYLESLLHAVAAEPGVRVGALPFLTGPERHQLLREWNDQQTDHPGPSLVHRLFEAQVERSPDALALASGDWQITYRELGARTHQLACRLRAAGVGPEARVGILLERSPEMVVSLLAALTAGGAYVPLDPTYPAERLAFMLADSRVTALVTREGLSLRLPALPRDLPVLTPGTDRPLSERETASLGSDAAEDNAAYVIYTSGSTGRPKGVVVSHRAISNRLQWMRQVYPLSPAHRVLQKTPFGFDVSVWEILGPLLEGACLVLARPEGHRDSAYLAGLIAEQQVTVAHFVPSMLRAFLEEPRADLCRSLARVLSSGEALSFDLQQRFFACLPAELANLYGPTEAAVEVTFHPCRRAGVRPVVPIGRPIDNIQIYVLDLLLQPMPPGLVGELYIGGVGLARCYLARPDLTAERFLPDPWSEWPGSRLYRTGDLVCHLENGELRFLGRLDHQVKIRGVRIELEEIEATLRLHPDVHEAVVLVNTSSAGGPRLEAFIVAVPEPAPSAAELREFVRSRLPEAMVPVSCQPISALPLTASGKLDRKALRLADRTAAVQGSTAPRTEIEVDLLRIWQDLLGTETIGVRSSFFELGGHSLLALRLMARIECAFGIRLPLSLLFQAPTIEGLARELQGNRAQPPQTSPLVLLQPHGVGPPCFLVHPVGGSVFCYLELARHLEGIPLYGLQADEQAPAESLEEMATAYLEAVKEAQPVGPYYLGGWSLGGVVAFEMARRLRSAGESVELLLLIDAPVPGGSGGRVEVMDEDAWFLGFASDLLRLRSVEWGEASQVLELEPEERLCELLKWAQGSGVFPPEVDLPRARALFALFKRNLSSLYRYAPVRFPGEIEYVLGMDRVQPGPEDRPATYWRGLAGEGLRVHTVPGDHYSILRAPAVGKLAETLRDLLARRLRIEVTSRAR